MKRLNVMGHEYFYRIFHDCSEYGDTQWTEFYSAIEVVERKKYFFFGPKIKMVVPKWSFTAFCDIEDPGFTKEMMQKIINKAWSSSDEAISMRKREIEEGRII